MSFENAIELTDRAVLAHLGAEDVVYQPQVGPPISIAGIFDSNFLIQSPNDTRREATTPAVWIKLADIAPNDPQTDNPTLTIRGDDYRVRQRNPDSPIGDSVHLFLQLVP